MANGRAVLAMGRRLAQLMTGLILMGVAVTALKQSRLGLGPWDVFHDGIARHTGIDLGVVGIVVGIPILLLWWPLHQRPGAGTVANLFVVGSVVHRLLPHTSPAGAEAARIGFMVAGIGLFALGQGLYLSVELGPGPRDGLMTGLNHRFGWSIRGSRTLIEAAALAGGIALGGSFGVATVLFAVTIGPTVQVTLRWFGFSTRDVPGLGDQPADAVGLTGE
jgi:uncharacterized membrane protein YczE